MINDFGEKIGGARKDVWKERGLMVEDLDGSIHTSSLMTATLPLSFIFAFSLIHCSNIRILSFRFCSYKNMRNVIGIKKFVCLSFCS